MNRSYDRTSGLCHICGKRLAWSNYAKYGRRGAWEIEHSVARTNGGTDHGNNLYGAHIRCNRQKGRRTSRTARGWHGRRCAPLSRAAHERRVQENAITGGGVGIFLGILCGSMPALVFFGILGAVIGSSVEPEE